MLNYDHFRELFNFGAHHDVQMSCFINILYCSSTSEYYRKGRMIADTDAVPLGFSNMIQNAVSLPSLFPKYSTIYL